MTQDRESKEFEKLLENLNLFFFGFFIFELITKLASSGLKQYFKDKFNWFDSSVVLVSAVDVVLQNVMSTVSVDGNLLWFNCCIYRRII